MRRVRLTLGYRGTRFAGWARQSPSVTHGLGTVQATVESALSNALGHTVDVQCAGRTDAGVHAEAQVVSFDTVSSMPATGIVQTLPRWLPDDVWVVDACAAETSFDARRSALRRWYHYAIWRSSSVPPAAWQGRCLVVDQSLDVDRMRAAARLLLGRHDFAAFLTRPSSPRPTVRTVYAADILAIDNDLLRFEICADAYLKQMVRTIVGSLLLVGGGRWSVEHFADALHSADRRRAGPTAPAVGLTLHHIDYRSCAECQ